MPGGVRVCHFDINEAGKRSRFTYRIDDETDTETRTAGTKLLISRVCSWMMAGETIAGGIHEFYIVQDAQGREESGAGKNAGGLPCQPWDYNNSRHCIQFQFTFGWLERVAMPGSRDYFVNRTSVLRVSDLRFFLSFFLFFLFFSFISSYAIWLPCENILLKKNMKGMTSLKTTSIS